MVSVADFSDQVRTILHQRSMGRCEVCATAAAVGSGAQAHHRLPRGAGGSGDPIKGRASNGLWLCLRCHTMIERNEPIVYVNGWKVRQGEFPAQVPVRLRAWGVDAWWLLDDDGMYLPADAPAA
jgi:hypothetical protein